MTWFTHPFVQSLSVTFIIIFVVVQSLFSRRFLYISFAIGAFIFYLFSSYFAGVLNVRIMILILLACINFFSIKFNFLPPYIPLGMGILFMSLVFVVTSLSLEYLLISAFNALILSVTILYMRFGIE